MKIGVVLMSLWTASLGKSVCALDLTSALTTKAARGAVFVMHRTVLALLQKVRDSNHQYLWQPPAGEMPKTLWGYPILLSDTMPGVADSAISTNFILFGNLQYVFLGDRQQMAMDTSSHVGFKQKIWFRASERIATVVAIPAAFARLRTAAA